LGDDAAVVADAEALYNELRGAGVDVLYDDRDVSAGVKFSDAELLGVPVRLTVSKKTVEAGIVEQQNRATGVVTSPTRHEVCASLR
jgi:prolyl-tRNA synthetase